MIEPTRCCKRKFTSYVVLQEVPIPGQLMVTRDRPISCPHVVDERVIGTLYGSTSFIQEARNCYLAEDRIQGGKTRLNRDTARAVSGLSPSAKVQTTPKFLDAASKFLKIDKSKHSSTAMH